MQITKCDICKKRLKSDSPSVHVCVGGILSNHVEICSDCGKPVLKLLKNKKLIDNDNKKIIK